MFEALKALMLRSRRTRQSEHRRQGRLGAGRWLIRSVLPLSVAAVQECAGLGVGSRGAGTRDAACSWRKRGTRKAETLVVAGETVSFSELRAHVSPSPFFR